MVKYWNQYRLLLIYEQCIHTFSFHYFQSCSGQSIHMITISLFHYFFSCFGFFFLRRLYFQAANLFEEFELQEKYWIYFMIDLFDLFNVRANYFTASYCMLIFLINYFNTQVEIFHYYYWFHLFIYFEFLEFYFFVKFISTLRKFKNYYYFLLCLLIQLFY